jgi:hypothetical protein
MYFHVGPASLTLLGSCCFLFSCIFILFQNIFSIAEER